MNGIAARLGPRSPSVSLGALYEEAARAKVAKGLDITLVTVQQLLTSDLADLVTPDRPALFAKDAQLPLPKGRSVKELPSVDDLVTSARSEAEQPPESI